MAEHTINFVEGDGISIQSSEGADGELWDVEIAATLTGLLEAKGDLLTADADAAARLPVGTDGQVLTADSTADTGLVWGSGSGGGGGDPAADTQVWMPLFDSDGAVVLDDTGVIPTLIPLA